MFVVDGIYILHKSGSSKLGAKLPTEQGREGQPSYLHLDVYVFLNNLSGHTSKIDYVIESYACFTEPTENLDYVKNIDSYCRFS
jgi:hypothetical protein